LFPVAAVPVATEVSCGVAVWVFAAAEQQGTGDDVAYK
jgi:hypothetical protein